MNGSLLRSLPAWVKVTVPSLALVAGTGMFALGSAGAATSLPPGTAHGCVYLHSNRTLERVYTNPGSGLTCPKGTFQVVWPNGADNDPAPVPDVNGSLASNTALPSSGPVSVATGGHFSTSKTPVGTVSVPAGKYLVSVNFKATPNAATSGAVFPQMMIYNGPQTGSDFSNNLFNIGNGSLEQFTSSPLPSNLIDSYFSGSGVITVPSGGETLNVYAFGYDSDGGAGSYLLDGATVSVVQVGS
ncbi:MAG: hypothetical protein ACM32E_19245 [Gemmatimonadota bacterium]